MNSIVQLSNAPSDPFSHIPLSSGAHASPDEGLCAMELVALMAGLPHSDKPDCTCPMIAGYVRRLNDYLGDDRESLRPYLPMLIGTVSNEHIQIRFEKAFQFTLTEVVATAIDIAGRPKLAGQVRQVAASKDFLAVAALLSSVDRGIARLCRLLYKIDSVFPYGAVDLVRRLSTHRIWQIGTLVRDAAGEYKEALSANGMLRTEQISMSVMCELSSLVVGICKLTPAASRKNLIPNVIQVLDKMLSAGPHGGRTIEWERWDGARPEARSSRLAA